MFSDVSRYVLSNLVGGVLAFGLVACAPVPAEPPTLYARLGGAPQVDTAEISTSSPDAMRSTGTAAGS